MDEVTVGDVIFNSKTGEEFSVSVTQSYSMAIGWNEDGTLRVEENGKVVKGRKARRIVGYFASAIGPRLFRVALDPEGKRELG